MKLISLKGYELIVFYHPAEMTRRETLEDPAEYGDTVIDRIEKNGIELTNEEILIYGYSDDELLEASKIYL